MCNTISVKIDNRIAIDLWHIHFIVIIIILIISIFFAVCIVTNTIISHALHTLTDDSICIIQYLFHKFCMKKSPFSTRVAPVCLKTTLFPSLECAIHGTFFCVC